MDGFARIKIKEVIIDSNALSYSADQVHFDAALFLAIERAVFERLRVNIAVQFLAYTRQQVQVEISRHACRIVVRSIQDIDIFLQIDPNQQLTIHVHHLCNALQQFDRVVRIKVADARTGEKGDFVLEGLAMGHVQRVTEIHAGRMHVQPGIIRCQHLC